MIAAARCLAMHQAGSMCGPASSPPRFEIAPLHPRPQSGESALPQKQADRPTAPPRARPVTGTCGARSNLLDRALTGHGSQATGFVFPPACARSTGAGEVTSIRFGARRASRWQGDGDLGV